MERIVQNYKAASLNVSSPFGKPKRTTPWKLARKRTKESTIFLPKRNLENQPGWKGSSKIRCFYVLSWRSYVRYYCTVRVIMLRVVRRLSCAVPTRYSAAKHGRGRTLAELSSNNGMKTLPVFIYYWILYLFIIGICNGIDTFGPPHTFGYGPHLRQKVAWWYVQRLPKTYQECWI